MATRKSASVALADAPPFTGIPAAGFKFLRDLKANNDRDWFRERKPLFEQNVQQPLMALAHGVAAEARARGMTLFPREKNPLTRIYRDIRFRADKTPFHTYLGAILHGPPTTGGIGEVYVHVSPVEPFAAAGFWMPERPFLHLWRARMAARPEAFRKVIAAIGKGRLAWIDGYELKRLPRGFESQAGSALEPFFKKQVFVVQQKLTPRQLQSPDIVGQLADFALRALPVLRFGWDLNYKPKRDMLEQEQF